MRRLTGALGLVVVLAGCGATKVVTTTETQTQTTTSVSTITRTITKHVKPRPAATSTAASTSSASAGATSGGGSTETIQDFDGNTLRVTSDGVVDPAAPANPGFADLKGGERLVAVKFTFSNAGPGTVSDNANSDTAVIGSDSQDYTPTFDDVSECTNFNAGDYTLANGSTQKGCVVFKLPKSVSVQSVQFGLGGNTIEFRR